MTSRKTRYLASRAAGANSRRRPGHMRAAGPGMSAVLATCQRTHETRCARELIALLTELIETNDDDIAGEQQCDEEEVSIEDALERERRQLDENRARSGLYQLDVGGVSGIVLIQVDLPAVHVVDLVVDAFRHLRQCNRPLTRYVERLIPIQYVCRASTADLQAAVADFVPVQFASRPEHESFSCRMQSRCNDVLERQATISVMAAAVLPPSRPVDLGDPRHILELQVIKHVAGLSCVSRTDYDLCHQWKWRLASEALLARADE